MGSRGLLALILYSGVQILLCTLTILLQSKHARFGDDPYGSKFWSETNSYYGEQLVAEVKGIYSGLVMVEAKCIEVDHKHAAPYNIM